ncbi:MAG: biotin--[Clostridia bacterium]|nr:biotin--[acetyl-CoA-carboxylase] ligase [Clostridia bacterium]
MLNEVLRALQSEEIVSGGELARTMGVTRAAVWKQVTLLRERGFNIETVGRQGYHLISCPDLLMEPLIEHDLGTVWAGQRVICYDSVDSTNRVLKKLASEGAEHGTLVLADEQTGGRGRRGRGWLTPKGTSIAMSLLLRPDMHPSRVPILSLGTSVAIAKGINAVTGLPVRIKWPNDIICNGKKLCGILLEMDANEEHVEYVVAGAGINVHLTEIPEEIQATATSLDIECGRPVSRIEIIRAVLRAAEETEQMIREGRLMETYLALSATLGRPVSVQGVRESFTGIAESIREDGTLAVRTDAGELREVMAGDVSVRGLMGYV